MAGKSATVIDISSRMRVEDRGFSGRSTGGPDRSRERDPESVIFSMETIGPVSNELKSLLALPKTLFTFPNETLSLSSDRYESTRFVADALASGAKIPTDLPDYGLHVSQRGGNAFCTLVDTARKLIVHHDIQNIYAENGSWEGFQFALKDAVALAKSMKASGTKFDFVVVKDGIPSTV